MKILVTGTHFTPAQAVMEELLRDPSVKIVYVGRKTTQEGDKTQSIESQVLPKLGIKFIPIIAGRINRFFSFYTLSSILKMPIGFIQAFWIVLKEQPDVILSFGGYVGVPIVFWGFWFSVPIIIHEQTLVSGLANTISNYFANRTAVSFKGDYDFKKNKIVLTGNPIRKELLGTKNAQMRKNGTKRELPVIFVTGGNQGSHIINQTIEEILENLLEIATIYHQTGDSKFKDYERLSEEKESFKNGYEYIVKKWFDGSEVSAIYHNADLVICRAGINTLTELAYFGIPAIVIPLPHLYKNEQTVNAGFFEELGLCKVLPQKELTPQKLFSMIKDSLKNSGKFKEKAKGAKEVVIVDAAKRLALETVITSKIYD